MGASFTKSAQYPFSAWLPLAIAAPTPVRALVHSSTLVTAGVFLIVRLEVAGLWVAFLGLFTSVMGAWKALHERDLKKVIALSTLSNLGVIVYALGLGAWWLALLHLAIHGLFKAIVFIGAGIVILANNHQQDIRCLSTRGRPLLGVLLIPTSFRLIAAPFLRGIYSKEIILALSLSQ